MTDAEPVQFDRDEWQRYLGQKLADGDPADWPGPPIVSGTWKDVGVDDALHILLDLTQQDLSDERGPLCDLYRPMRVRIRHAPFYKEFLLCEALFETEQGIGIAAFLYGEHGVVLLDLTSDPLHRLNDKLETLIKNKVEAQEYLELFVAALRSDAGRFRIVTTLSECSPAGGASDDLIRELESKLKPVTCQVDGDGTWRFETTTLYGNSLFAAVFEVSARGEVEMAEDEEIMSEAPVKEERHLGPIRLP